MWGNSGEINFLCVILYCWYNIVINSKRGRVMLHKRAVYNETDKKWYESTHQAAREIGCSQSSISRCCQLGRYYPKGKVLRYIDRRIEDEDLLDEY